MSPGSVSSVSGEHDARQVRYLIGIVSDYVRLSGRDCDREFKGCTPATAYQYTATELIVAPRSSLVY